MKLHGLEDCWETFLPISRSSHLDDAPAADALWLASKGIDSEALTVLHHLRNDVYPVVRELPLGWYCFLVHGRDSVPCPPDDSRAFIHLRFQILRDVNESGVQPNKALWANEDVVTAASLSRWLWTRRASLSREIAGVDAALFKGFEERAWEALGEQSRLVLDLVHAHSEKVDDFLILKHCRQYMHFFANMLQMRVA